MTQTTPRHKRTGPIPKNKKGISSFCQGLNITDAIAIHTAEIIIKSRIFHGIDNAGFSCGLIRLFFAINPGRRNAANAMMIINTISLIPDNVIYPLEAMWTK